MVSIEKPYRSFIIDDDQLYHLILDKLFEHSNAFDGHQHYTDGQDALDFLYENHARAAVLPDIIFIDINMPQVGAWKFLEKFSSLSVRIEKQITIYLMTNFVQKEYQENIKAYPYVKGVISKNFDVSFLNGIVV